MFMAAAPKPQTQWFDNESLAEAGRHNPNPADSGHFVLALMSRRRQIRTKSAAPHRRRYLGSVAENDIAFLAHDPIEIEKKRLFRYPPPLPGAESARGFPP